MQSRQPAWMRSRPISKSSPTTSPTSTPPASSAAGRSSPTFCTRPNGPRASPTAPTSRPFRKVPISASACRHRRCASCTPRAKSPAPATISIWRSSDAAGSWLKRPTAPPSTPAPAPSTRMPPGVSSPRTATVSCHRSPFPTTRHRSPSARMARSQCASVNPRR